MRNPILDVLDFHRLTETQVGFKPQPLTQDRKDLRKSLIMEEVVKELIPAIDNDDIQQILDGAVDGIYVILGTLIEYGLTGYFAAAWNEVHRSNMTKVDPELGIIKREDGKVLKPASYSPADLAKVIARIGNYETSMLAVFSDIPTDQEFTPEIAKAWLKNTLHTEDVLVNQLYFDTNDCTSWTYFKIKLYTYLIKSMEAQR